MAQKVFKKGVGVVQPTAPGKSKLNKSLDAIASSKEIAKPKSAPEPVKRRPPEPKPERRADELPLVSVLPRSKMDLAIKLIQEDVAIQEAMAGAAARRAAIKESLAAICKDEEQPGLRYGQLAVYYNGEKTKWSLNRAMLLENGVTPEQLEESMKESKPFIDLTIRDLSKPRGKGHGEEE